MQGVLKVPKEKERRVHWSVSARYLLDGVLVDPGTMGAVPVAADGTFLLDGLPPGPLTLQVFRRGGKKLERTVTLPLPGDEPLVIEVRE